LKDNIKRRDEKFGFDCLYKLKLFSEKHERDERQGSGTVIKYYF
jgi:hypothetical protein